MEQVNNYWRTGLGSEFRNQALDYIGGYAETYGGVKLSEDGKTYTADLDVNAVLNTIVPLNLACDANKRDVRFVSLIHVDGKIGRGKLNMKRRNKEKITLIDNQNNEINAQNVCVDSLLYLLDYLDSTLKAEDKKTDINDF